MPRRKTRLSRNDSEQMGQELHARGEAYNQFKGDPKNRYLATLINPVDHRLYDVVVSGSRVYIVAPIPSEEYQDPSKYLYSFGQGSVDTDDQKEVEVGRIQYTLGRSHTPSGVGAKGTGQGLMLYCGLAIQAKYKSIDGIYSSSAQRSASATAWWNSQVSRGLAEQDAAYVTGYTTTEIDLERALDLEDIPPSHMFENDGDAVEQIQLTDLSPKTVEVDINVEGRIEFQYLTTIKVAESGYCVAWDAEDADLEEVFSSYGVGQPKEVILGIDLSTTADPVLIQSLIKDLQEEGATEEELVRFLNRVPKRLLKQMKDSEVKELYGQLRLALPEELAANTGAPSHSKAWQRYFGDSINSN